jgi:hypothetical protein
MKAHVGTNGNYQAAEDDANKDSRDSAKTTEVGPFSSAEEAGQWLRFMSRGESEEQVKPPLQSSEDGLWYCFMIDKIKR